MTPMLAVGYSNNCYKIESEVMEQQKQKLRSPSQSRVSSSTSSHHSQSYELIPREESFPRPHPDLPSPRASFPFKRVQPGVESSIHSRSQNDSRSSLRGDNQREEESKELIEAIGQLNRSRNVPKMVIEEERLISSQLRHEECNARIKELEGKIMTLEETMESERTDVEMEKKANEIYTEGFTQIRQILMAHFYVLEGEGVEEVVEQLSHIIKTSKEGKEVKKGKESKEDIRGNGIPQKMPQDVPQEVRELQLLIEQQDNKIRQLRAELLKSSQNNINAIFNTEITEAHCLHLQIIKMNGEIVSLKESLIKVSTEKEPRENNQGKVVNIYHHSRHGLESEEEEDVHTELKLTRRRHSKNNNNNEQYNKSRIMSNTESKIGELVEGYKVLREEYKRMENTLGQVYENHSDYRHMFQSLRGEISTSLENQLKEVKQTLRRPSSNTSEVRVARDIESKLNHLVNTLNAPERVNIEDSLGEDEAVDWKNVEVYHRVLNIESQSSHLEQQVHQLEFESEGLKKRLWVQEHNPHHSLQESMHHHGHSLTQGHRDVRAAW